MLREAVVQALKERTAPDRLIDLMSVYDGWSIMRVATIELSDGQHIHREVEDHGRAVAVLPYDPERRVALLVRLLRAPVLVANSKERLLEAPAGIMEEDDPDACARREAMEECGLKLGALEHVMTAWTMPGISTEQMDLYLAPYAAADHVAAGGGVPEEHEDIVPVELSLREVLNMADRGELTDMKTYSLVMSLHRRHPELFQ
jgi:nudix-type nucleoside diphosphatase (YffH/AdpP family)